MLDRDSTRTQRIYPQTIDRFKMLFNTPFFIFIFLPIAAIGFFCTVKIDRRLGIVWFILSSLYFYAIDDFSPWYVLLSLILLSISTNYAIAFLIRKYQKISPSKSKWAFILGIVFNIALLGLFKYADFAISNFNALIGTSFTFLAILLPAGISFYTFTQIAYLADTYRNKAPDHKILNYFLFVTIFPHLIAGPIIYHKEIMPQFLEKTFSEINFENISVGLTIFFIGLFKKVVLADTISVYADAVFGLAGTGASISFLTAWMGALAFTFQIYFDFSGYSDMAIGLARIFNVKFPLNFSSPYKSTSIIEFWRTWHMTLSRFLKDYVYIPLGGNRKGISRRYLNLFLTMLIGGLWHGASWTFVLWGGLHGFFLMVNHGLEKIFLNGREISNPVLKLSGQWSARIITFIAVIFAWVVFRAHSLDEVAILWKGMVGGNGFSTSFSQIFAIVQFNRWSWILFLLLLIVCWFFPNSQEIMRNYSPAIDFKEKRNTNILHRVILWKPSLLCLCIIGIIAVLSFDMMENVKVFLYYQF